MRLWRHTEEHSEGKYLVVRRDGTIPPWPHFVIGAADPCAPAALKAYADEADRIGLDAEFAQSVNDEADNFELWRLSMPATMKKADPDAGPHREDNPFVLGMMRGDHDLSGYSAIPHHERLPIFHLDAGETALILTDAQRRVVKAAIEQALGVDGPLGESVTDEEFKELYGLFHDESDEVAPEDEALAIPPLPRKVITLTPAEIQSGHDRVQWAENLIRQLPGHHEGRNSWLKNYGAKPE